MKKESYHYEKGSAEKQEIICFKPEREGFECTACKVYVPLLLSGVCVYPTEGGGHIILTQEERLKLLKQLRNERQKILASYPVKDLKAFLDCGLPSFEDFCRPGDKIDESIVRYFTDNMPLVLSLSYCTQCGEPHSYEDSGRSGIRPTYTTFHKVEGRQWEFDGYCFYQENYNRAKTGNRLDEEIRKLEMLLGSQSSKSASVRE